MTTQGRGAVGSLYMWFLLLQSADTMLALDWVSYTEFFIDQMDVYIPGRVLLLLIFLQ